MDMEVRPLQVNPELPNVLLVGTPLLETTSRRFNASWQMWLTSISLQVRRPLEIPTSLINWQNSPRWRTLPTKSCISHGWTYSEPEYSKLFQLF
jgi:hypothetical protein